MEIFTVKYVIKKGTINDNEMLLAKKEGHVIQEIMGDESQTLQFFESDFYFISKRSVGSYIKSKLNGCGNFINVLSAGPPAACERELEL